MIRMVGLLTFVAIDGGFVDVGERSEARLGREL